MEAFVPSLCPFPPFWAPSEVMEPFTTQKLLAWFRKPDSEAHMKPGFEALSEHCIVECTVECQQQSQFAGPLCSSQSFCLPA